MRCLTAKERRLWTHQSHQLPPLAPLHPPPRQRRRETCQETVRRVCVCVCHSPPILTLYTEDGGVDSGGEEEEGVDLKKMAEDYASYLVINSKQDVREMHTHAQVYQFNAKNCRKYIISPQHLMYPHTHTPHIHPHHTHRRSNWMNVLRMLCFVWKSSKRSWLTCILTSPAPRTRCVISMTTASNSKPCTPE